MTTWPLTGVLVISLAFLGCSNPDRDLPSAYRGLKVPIARLQSAEARGVGRQLFLEHCALCHGVDANGHGVRREGLSAQPPPDFTSRAWRQKSTPRHIFFAIREGVAGTAMPKWKFTLDVQQTWDLVAYILSVGEPVP